MTSFAFILGVLPMARAIGPGSEIRQVLGTAVFTGMLGVTIFGLFLTPTFYVVLRGISNRFWPEAAHKPILINTDETDKKLINGNAVI